VWEQLEGVRLKFIAAAEHMQRFEDAVERFFEGKVEVAEFTGQTNSQRTKYLVRVERVRRYPDIEWGIIIGDAIHCWRSALDQLVYAFAKDPSHQTSYPICLTEKEWATKAPAQYWSCAPGFVRLLDKTQPYHREDPSSHPLAILRALSNLDKHRGITTVALVTDTAEVEVRRTAGIRKWQKFTWHIGTPYEKRAVVAESKIVPDDSGLEPYMEVHIDGTLDVAFGQIAAAPGLRNRLVIDVLDEVGEYIAKVVRPIGEAWDEAVTKTGSLDEEARDWMR
jgi:hypothetical protein